MARTLYLSVSDPMFQAIVQEAQKTERSIAKAAKRLLEKGLEYTSLETDDVKGVTSDSEPPS